MSERLDLIHLEIGVSEAGIYCTTYLTDEAQVFRVVDEKFQKLLDDINAAVAGVLSKEATEGGKGKAHGPGAETLAKALGEQGVDVEVVEKPASSFANAGLPIH